MKKLSEFKYYKAYKTILRFLIFQLAAFLIQALTLISSWMSAQSFLFLALFFWPYLLFWYEYSGSYLSFLRNRFPLKKSFLVYLFFTSTAIGSLIIYHVYFFLIWLLAFTAGYGFFDTPPRNIGDAPELRNLYYTENSGFSPDIDHSTTFYTRLSWTPFLKRIQTYDCSLSNPLEYKIQDGKVVLTVTDCKDRKTQTATIDLGI